MLKQLLPFVMICAALPLSTCGRNITPTGPEQHESRAVDLDKSERARVELKMPVGELDVRGGAQKLLDADFTYNVTARKPDIRYRSAGAAGDLIIEQHGPTSSSGNTKNHWDLRFNDNVPLDLRVEFGAGEGRLREDRSRQQHRDDRPAAHSPAAQMPCEPVGAACEFRIRRLRAATD